MANKIYCIFRKILCVKHKKDVNEIEKHGPADDDYMRKDTKNKNKNKKEKYRGFLTVNGNSI